MLVGDLLELPGITLRCLVGENHLDRPVRWVFTSDLLDPSRYLSGGELVLTGLMWRQQPADSETFVAAVAATGAACVAAGDAAYGGVPADLVDACARHGLPLIEVPVDVSFSDVSEAVHSQLIAERHQELATQLRRRRQLVSSVAQHGGLDALLALSAADPDVPFWLLTGTGRVPALAPSRPQSPRARRLAPAFLSADAFPHLANVRSTDGSTEYSLFPVGDNPQPRVIGWFLACEGDYRQWPADTIESIRELASLVSLERERREEIRRLQNIGLERLLRATLSGDYAEAGDLSAQVKQLGLDNAPYVVVVAAVTPASGGATARSILVDLLRPLIELPNEIVHATTIGNEAIAIVAVHNGNSPVADSNGSSLVADRGGRSPVADHLRSYSPLLSRGLNSHRLLIGVSMAASTPGELPSALAEARQASRLAEIHSGALSVVASDEMDSHQLLLSAVPAEVRAAYRDRVLGPLRRYDDDHGSDLVPTLQAFLDCSCSFAQCADRLHLHVNSLRYRIQRIEELTGRSLTSLDGRVAFYLALRL